MVVWSTLMNTLVPAEMLGRVSSVDWFVSIGLTPLSFALTGPVAELLGARTTLAVAGAFGLLSFALLFVPGVRDPERLPLPESVLSRSRPRDGVGRVLAVPLGAGLEPAIEDLAEHRGARGPQRQREHVRVVPPSRAARRLGVRAQRGSDARDLVRGDRRAGTCPAAHDRLFGTALRDVAGGGLRGPGPVVALVLGERAVQQRLVAAAAQLLHDGLGDASALVGGDGDSQRASLLLGHARAARGRDHRPPPVTRRAGATIESALAPGMVTMKTFDPPLDALAGARSPACGGRARCWWWRSGTWRCWCT